MIAICTPTRDTVQAGFAFDLIQLVKQSLTQASHVLFIDSDMRFPVDVIERLKAHNLDVVGANCRHRQADKWTGGESSEGKTGLSEVKQIGFGVTLIKTGVFRKLLEPWFATPYDGTQFVGEDIFFCHKAREAGFKIWIDHDASKEVKHIGSVEL